MAVMCLWICVGIHLLIPGVAQHLAARSLEHKGAGVYYRFDGMLLSRTLGPGSPLLRQGGWIVDCFWPVERLDMHKNATDDDLRSLMYLSGLRELSLAYCYDISDKGVEHVKVLRRLRALRLYRNDPDEHDNFTPKAYDLSTQPRITDMSLAHVSHLTRLKELYLWDNDFSDDGILLLRSLRQLRILRFRSPRISERAIVLLRLDLPNTQIEAD